MWNQDDLFIFVIRKSSFSINYSYQVRKTGVYGMKHVLLIFIDFSSFFFFISSSIYLRFVLSLILKINRTQIHWEIFFIILLFAPCHQIFTFEVSFIEKSLILIFICWCRHTKRERTPFSLLLIPNPSIATTRTAQMAFVRDNFFIKYLCF